MDQLEDIRGKTARWEEPNAIIQAKIDESTHEAKERETWTEFVAELKAVCWR